MNQNQMLIRFPKTPELPERLDIIYKDDIQCISGINLDEKYTYISLKSGYGYKVQDKLSYVLKYYNQNNLDGISYLTISQGEDNGKRAKEK